MGSNTHTPEPTQPGNATGITWTTQYVSYHYNPTAEILSANYHRGLHVTLEMAKQIVADRLGAANVYTTPTRKVRCLLFFDSTVKMDDDARQYLTGPDGEQGLCAVAIVAEEWAYWMLLKTMSLFSHPGIPVGTFHDADKATTWLMKYPTTA